VLRLGRLSLSTTHLTSTELASVPRILDAGPLSSRCIALETTGRHH
jgi:hypothetical protein